MTAPPPVNQEFSPLTYAPQKDGPVSTKDTYKNACGCAVGNCPSVCLQWMDRLQRVLTTETHQAIVVHLYCTQPGRPSQRDSE